MHDYCNKCNVYLFSVRGVEIELNAESSLASGDNLCFRFRYLGIPEVSELAYGFCWTGLVCLLAWYHLSWLIF
jgi:hypothetical protein